MGVGRQFVERASMGNELAEAVSLVAGACWPGTGPLVGAPHVAHEQPTAVSSAESRMPPTKIVLSRMLFLLVKRKKGPGFS